MSGEDTGITVAYAKGSDPNPLKGAATNPQEVAAVYRIPFTSLYKPGSPEFVTIPESDRPVIRMPIAGTKIHAPTAAVIFQFREVVLGGRSTRVDHLEQPVFAWR